MDVMTHDGVKCAVAGRVDKMKKLDTRSRIRRYNVPRSLSDVFEHMISGNCMDRVIDEHQNK